MADLHAATNEESTKISEEIVITATRTEEAVSKVSASVTLIDANEIALRSVESPEALLKNEAGIDLAITPGGVVDRIVLRGIPEGFSGNTTQYLLNGMPVDPVQIASNRTVWQLISTADIERLEVVRGPASALYGANAMGGVINIITKRGAADPFMRAVLEGGSHNARTIGLHGGGNLGDVDLYLSARESRSDGYRPTLESSWDGLDYDLSGRKNERRHFNGSLSYWPTDRQEFDVGVYHYRQEDDWLGGHPNQRSESDGTGADLAYHHELGDTTQLTIKLLTLDSTSDVYIDNSYEDFPEDALVLEDRYEDRERSTSAEFQLNMQPLERHTLILGASYSAGTWELDGSERYSDYPAWTSYSKTNESQVAALFIHDQIELSKQLLFSLGGRYDRYRFEEIQVEQEDRPDAKDSVFTPRASLRFQLSEAYSIYASAGKGYIPANPGLMYRSGSSWLDNTDLEPESSTSWESGLNFSGLNGKLNGSLALYRTDYKDRITSMYVTTDGQSCTEFPCFRQYQNITAIRVKGAELILKGKIGDHWRPFFNYTLNDSKIRENESDPETKGNSPAYSPKHKINLGTTYVGNKGFGARVAGRYVSTRYWSDRHYDWTQLDNFFTVDTKLIQRFSLNGKLPDMELSLAINNLFDKSYSEWKGELADGRNWWLGVTTNF
ncbi:MAG: TonB-dependent receptor [Candidatus Thiodiazotropha sp.]